MTYLGNGILFREEDSIGAGTYALVFRGNFKSSKDGIDYTAVSKIPKIPLFHPNLEMGLMPTMKTSSELTKSLKRITSTFENEETIYTIIETKKSPYLTERLKFRSNIEVAHQGATYLFHELVLKDAGENLHTYLDTFVKTTGGQLLPEKEALSISIQMVRAVKALHEIGFAHLDIYPNNFLIKDGQVKLTDYGTAKRIGDPIEITEDQKIYPHEYRPPEAFKNWRLMYDEKVIHTIDKESEVWPLACCIFKVWTTRTWMGSVEIDEDTAYLRILQQIHFPEYIRISMEAEFDYPHWVERFSTIRALDKQALPRKTLSVVAMRIMELLHKAFQFPQNRIKINRLAKELETIVIPNVMEEIAVSPAAAAAAATATGIQEPIINLETAVQGSYKEPQLGGSTFAKS